MSDLDPEKIGLKVGLEIHQQLNTQTKLFCSCAKFEEKDFRYTIYRRLRPTQSELGEVDPAARFEFAKGLTIKYDAGQYSACLVEADEEPPHPLNPEAIRTVLIIALALNSQTVDELHVMRKIVIDGSNTTGFQRTLIAALGGDLKVGSKQVGVQTICLEEDAARLIAEAGGVRGYSLDRLTVPLVEIALAPVTGTPKDILEVALTLGRLLRSTRLVSRGLGTIRQDINVSVQGGAVVEVKGVQKLDLLEKVVEYEAQRQIGIIRIKEELEKRRLSPNVYNVEPIDVTNLFKETGSTVLQRALKRDEHIRAIPLKGTAGLLGLEPYPDVRLGRELADVARFFGLGGLMHSDELPGYGVTAAEIDLLRQHLQLAEQDGFLLLSGEDRKLHQACEAVLQRMRDAFKGVLAETRAATPDGKTRFIRPRPGAARMYPETDIPPIPLSPDLIETLRKEVPKPWNEQIEEYMSKYSLSRKLALQVYDTPYFELFEQITAETKVSPSFIAATLTETLVNLSREGLDTSTLTSSLLKSLFTQLDQGRISKEAVPEILGLILRREAGSVEEAAAKLGLTAINDQELLKVVQQVLAENKGFVEEKGDAAFSLLMGRVMAKVRGKADGKKISDLLRSEIRKMLPPH
ncbi:MAG: Glu-tRNA(Gln) amidotransferase subunit GatE [Thaumarchaeota archaeon]|nr:Glu-tRNA(Gln) amidotransferase subunit GatE [Nitrososphaerota archaeon]MCL5316702.1 Glu-tRNA(Gln) amidotransferase subunit GatE [Nitrososphaerota archaeon]